MKSHFGMGALPRICYIFSEFLFIRTLIDVIDVVLVFFVVNFEHTSHLFLVLLLITLNM